MSQADIAAILRFWFEEAGKEKWFRGGAAFDRDVAARLGDLHARAAADELDGWAESADGALALLILLDQVPRNIHRGTPAAFATDAKALAIARRALEQGFDLAMPDDDRRAFLYLPFEHSEDIADQRLAVCLFEERTSHATYQDYARRHLAVVERFGRFPHRNAILGRAPRPEELAAGDMVPW